MLCDVCGKDDGPALSFGVGYEEDEPDFSWLNKATGVGFTGEAATLLSSAPASSPCTAALKSPLEQSLDSYVVGLEAAKTAAEKAKAAGERAAENARELEQQAIEARRTAELLEQKAVLAKQAADSEVMLARKAGQHLRVAQDRVETAQLQRDISEVSKLLTTSMSAVLGSHPLVPKTAQVRGRVRTFLDEVVSNVRALEDALLYKKPRLESIPSVESVDSVGVVPLPSVASV